MANSIAVVGKSKNLVGGSDLATGRSVAAAPSRPRPRLAAAACWLAAPAFKSCRRPHRGLLTTAVKIWWVVQDLNL